MKEFEQKRYVLLEGLCQGGKTGAYLLAMFRMIHLGKSSNGIVICGASSTNLRDQAKNDVKKAIQTYAYENGLHSSLFDNIEVKFSNELKKDKTPIKDGTIIVHDESHYGQSVGQGIDNWYTKNGLQNVAAGRVEALEARNINILSVSATLFSEKINAMKDPNPTKGYVRLIPPPTYRGVRHYHDNELIHASFCPSKNPDAIKRLFHSLPPNKYGILRAQGKNREAYESLIRECGIKLITYDMNSDKGVYESINTILDDEPTQPTIILLKGACRMGEVLTKRHVRWVYEGSKTIQTDTLIQSLLGRMSGIDCEANPFPKEDIDIYIPKSSLSEIEGYLNDQLPSKGAMNVKKTKTVKVDSGEHGYQTVPINISDHIPRETYNLMIDSAKDVVDYLFKHYREGVGPWENLTDHQYLDIQSRYLEKGRKVISERGMNSKSYIKDKVYERMVDRFNSKTPFVVDNNKDDKYRINLSYSGGVDNSPKVYEWLTTFSESPNPSHIGVSVKSLPQTTGKEIFQYQKEDGGVVDNVNGGQIIYLSQETSHSPQQFERELSDAIVRSKIIPGCSKEITSLIGLDEAIGISISKTNYSIHKGKGNTILDEIFERLEKTHSVKFNPYSKASNTPKNFDKRVYIRIATISWVLL
jgi:hypothetical protein